MTRVLLATSNGTGLGHLSRQLAVAHALQGVAEPTIFSMSTAVALLAEQGVRAEYCPSLARGWHAQGAWHGYLRQRLVALVREIDADVVVFDGVVPYAGLLQARRVLPDVGFIWSRRGMWRPGANTAALRTGPAFDLIIEPGDLAAAADRGATAGRSDATPVAPICLAAHVPKVSRSQAAAALGLDPDRPTALVTLSSGVLNDVRTPAAAAVDALLRAGWQIALVSHLAGGAAADDQPVVPVRGVFPLVRYLAAFDGAVSACGYNSFHELLGARIPTVFVANRSSGTDDQAARAGWAGAAGVALAADEADADDLGRTVSALTDEARRAELSAACATLPAATGSRQAADLVVDLADRPAGGGSRRVDLEAALRVSAHRLLRGGTTTAVTRGGRGPGHLDIADQITSDLLADGTVVEHVLAGSSGGYRAARERLAATTYAVLQD